MRPHLVYQPLALPKAHAKTHAVIKRNPFLPPLPPKSTAAAAPQLLLKGIVGSAGKRFAIVEYSGEGNFYSVGGKIGSYTVTAIGADFVTLQNGGSTLRLSTEGTP